jgi:GrpB-like predicted nucleotidyltransferase (UPF0157 family)
MSRDMAVDRVSRLEVRLKSDSSGAQGLAPGAITVVNYEPAWPTQFKQLRLTILPAVGDAAVAIEHVGSTAVPGLAAKPIIDIDPSLRSRKCLPQCRHSIRD